MRLLTPVALCMVMLVTATGSAVAQTAGRPYRGLFGSGVGDASQVLSVSASLGGGYDDDVLAEATDQGGVSDPTAARSSGYGSFKGGLRYSLNRRRLSFGVSGGSSVRLYSDEIGGHVATHSVNTGGSFQLARRTSVTLSQRVSYQPFLTVLPFPQVFEPDFGDIPPPQPELATADTAYIVYSSSANLSQQLSRRGSLGVSYSYSKSDFTHDEAHFSTQTGGVRYSHALAKGLGFYVGYSYTDAQHTNGNNVAGQGLDAGLDYSRALSVSRHTTLTFGTGSTAVTDGVFTQYYVTGNASLAHQIGRTWSASLTYSRSAQFLEAFSEPYFADTAAAGLTGLLHRRVQFNASLAASFGSVGLRSSSGFDTYTATTNVTWALARYVGLGASYSYYRYSLDSGTSLSGSVPPQMDRQSVTAYLNAWLPLMVRKGRP